jgi:uncharacterized protein YbbC (DUF1343 family)
MSGLHRLLKMDPLPMAGARVGFLGHHASVTSSGLHAIDALSGRTDWTITRLFSPEHGFFGLAGPGESVDHALHPKWNLPVHSLYGEFRSPDPEWLQDLDLMVVDLQDLGVRCYTYASTLQNMLQACAKASLPVLVLDRPIPLAGIVDGPRLDPSCKSFVGQVPLPLVYGMSQGKLALYLKKNDYDLRELDLQVLDQEASAPASSWIPPSPAIVSVEAALLYPLTVWSEAIPDVWVDRGGPRSFQCWAMPDLSRSTAEDLSASLNLPGIHCTAQDFETPKGSWSGLAFQLDPCTSLLPVTAAVQLLCKLRDLMGKDRFFASPDSRPEFFDQLMGTETVRSQISSGLSSEEICSWA